MEDDANCVEVKNGTSANLTNTTQQQPTMGNVAKVRPQPQQMPQPNHKVAVESPGIRSLSSHGANIFNPTHYNSTKMAQTL